MDKLRIDKWIWHTRFFKTRSLAADAVRAGHVRVAGQRVKTSRDVGVGDAVVVHKGPLTYELTVRALPPRRVSAKEAALCYAESEESIARRELRQSELRLNAALMRPPTRERPDKRTRRLIRSRKES